MYLLGSFHAGVTSLGQKLARHPSVVTDGMSFGQFWAEDGKSMQTFVEGFSAATREVRRV